MNKFFCPAAFCAAVAIFGAVKENYRYLRIDTLTRAKVYSLATLDARTEYSDMFINARGELICAYVDGAQKIPYLLQKKGGMVSTTVIDSGWNTGRLLSLYYDNRLSSAHCVYYDAPVNALKYADNLGSSSFNAYVVDRAEGMRYRSPQAIVETNGGIHVFFLDGKGQLWHAVNTNGMFRSRIVYRERPLSDIRLFIPEQGMRFICRTEKGELLYLLRDERRRYKSYLLPGPAAVRRYTAFFDSRGRSHILFTDDDRSVKYFYYAVDSTFQIKTIVASKSVLEGMAIITERLDTPHAAITTRDEGISIFISDPGTTSFKPRTLSMLGRARGALSLGITYYPYISVLFYDSEFNELRLAELNLESIRAFVREMR
ncbi:MAG: hypothetical protein AABZ39_11980 [Spirochaetota bacterium]